MTLTAPKDPVESLSENLELLERHISILRTVRDNQPVGLIRLSEMTGIPKHRVRYSLKIMEQQGIIVATPEGATVSEDYDKFMDEMAESVESLAMKVVSLRDSLKNRSHRSVLPERPDEPLDLPAVRRNRILEAIPVQRFHVERPEVRAEAHPGSEAPDIQEHPSEPVRGYRQFRSVAPHERQRLPDRIVQRPVHRHHRHQEAVAAVQ